jgi:hypothetical protein
MNAEGSLWMRYMPGLVAAGGGATILLLWRRRHAIAAATLATLLGLTCMEAEYWVAHGFPSSEVSFFASAVVVTLIALALGRLGGAALGILGLGFFAYVNLRYGAPYLLDYVQPILYALLLARSRREWTWKGSSWLRAGWTEGLWIAVTYSATFWRTTSLDKWGWMTGRPW